MAKCPACEREIATPFVLNVDAWRWLRCPHCASRLERKSPRFFVALGPLLIVLIALGGRSHRFAVVAEALMAVALLVIVVEFLLLPPRLQARKALPEPEIMLKVNGPGKP